MATKAKTGIVALAAAGVAAGALSCSPKQANADVRIGICVQGTQMYTPPPVYYAPRPVYYAPSYVTPVQQYAPAYVPEMYVPRPVYVPQQVYPPVQQYAPAYVPERVYYAPQPYVPQPYVGVRMGPRGVGLRIGGETPLGWINIGLRLRR